MPDAYIMYQLSGSYMFFGVLTPAIATVSILDIVLKTTIILRALQRIEDELQRDFYRGTEDCYIFMFKHSYYKAFK